MFLLCLTITAELLQRGLQTRLLANATMFGPMVAVKLPEGVLTPSTGLKPPYDIRAAHAVKNVLHYEFKIEVMLIYSHCMQDCILCELFK